MEKYITGTGQRLKVHTKEDCVGANCVIHNPSQHSLSAYPTHWRDDRKLMERICIHGVGHPDPDDLAFKLQTKGKEFVKYESIHGCDGCCDGI